MAGSSIREAVAVFDDAASLRTAADQLMLAGFDRAQLSLLGTRKAIIEKLGRMYDKAAELEDHPRVPMGNYVGTDSLTEAKAALIAVPCFIGAIAAAGPAIATGASLARTLVLAALGAIVGGALGAVAAAVIAARQANRLQDQIKRGGILLWVRTMTEEQEKLACDILNKVPARDVHVHERPVVEDWDLVYGYLDWLAGVPKPLRDQERTVV